MVRDTKLSRRQLLKAGAAGATVAALSSLGPAGVFAAPAAGKGNGRLIPEDKVGTITFTQRDVPGRQGISTGNATMDPRGRQLPGRSDGPRTAGPPARRLERTL